MFVLGFVMLLVGLTNSNFVLIVLGAALMLSARND